jgi:quercetin dioxygenase-like cupin family protein
MSKTLAFFAAAIAISLCGPAANAQQPEPIKRTILQTGNFPGDKMSTLLILVEVIPNVTVARHTHPGGEVGYVLDGAIEFTIGEQPPKTFKQGDTYQIPVGAPHLGKTGPGGVKLMATFVVEKDKPLATPAP